MCATQLPTVPASSALRLVGLLVVVAGLFGMHGLASHGVDGMDVLPGTALTAQSTAPSVLAGDAPAVVGHGLHNAAIDPSLEPSRSGRGGLDMGIAMLCVAILGAALLGLVWLLRAERPSAFVWARPHRQPVIVQTGRGPGPPSLVELSIQRC